VTRVAAVDLGTNSTRLLVADVSAGELSELERSMRITRLGDAVDATGRLSDAAIQRVDGCVAEYAATARMLGAERTLAVATSAVRDAANGRDFLAGLGARHHIETRLLVGTDEAAMTFRGVTSARSVEAGALVCDIGGGSTELVLGGPDGVSDRISLDIGCVRLSERHLADGPTDANLAALRTAVREAIPHRFAAATRHLIGVAGTVTTLATIDLGLAEEIPELVDRHELAAATVERQLARLAALDPDELTHVRGLLPARAPTIVAGTAILAELMDVLGAASLSVSERDILHGAALTAADGVAQPR
jgi:exopolyphosphatase/guanosine-5'-triphosphate,3'-diphosphate pyrophosphatase